MYTSAKRYQMTSKQIETYPLTARMQTLSKKETLGVISELKQLVHSLKNYHFQPHAKHFEQSMP